MQLHARLQVAASMNALSCCSTRALLGVDPRLLLGQIFAKTSSAIITEALYLSTACAVVYAASCKLLVSQRCRTLISNLRGYRNTQVGKVSSGGLTASEVLKQLAKPVDNHGHTYHGVWSLVNRDLPSVSAAQAVIKHKLQARFQLHLWSMLRLPAPCRLHDGWKNEMQALRGTTYQCCLIFRGGALSLFGKRRSLLAGRFRP